MSYIGTEPNQDVTINSKEYIATEGQVKFPVVFDSYVEVFVNGARLAKEDFTRGPGTYIDLVVPATAGDVVQANGYVNASYLEEKVSKTGDETIDGIKNFTSSPIVPTPTVGDNSTKVATTAFVKSNGVEVASIITMPVNSIPSGYLECNGAVLSRTTYADLFSVIGTTYGSGDGSTTFNIPDLRGEFIRGFDNGRGVDSGRNIGTWQEDTFQGFQISETTGVGVAPNSYPATQNVMAGGNNNVIRSNAGSVGGKGFYPATDGTNGTPRISDQTRPRNIAMMYCIKY